MRVLLSFLLYTTICWAIEPSIVSRFESNELFPENNIQTLDGEIEPTIDPNIAEDANLTTVLPFFSILFFEMHLNSHHKFISKRCIQAQGLGFPLLFFRWIVFFSSN